MKTPALRSLLFVALACACSRPAEPALEANLGRVRVLDGALAARSLPAPTEHVLDDGAEARNKADRKRWFAEMHRAADGVDWRALERANAEADMQRRNALAASGAHLALANAWSEVGSRNQAGRMLCASLSPDGQRLYAGAALGGVWRRSYALDDWAPLGDNLYGGVEELALLPGEYAGDPDVLVIANSSVGVRVTRDQGLTWEAPTGLGTVTGVRTLQTFADAAHTLVLWAQTSYFGNAPALFVSTDYGRTFSKRYQLASAGNSDAWIPRTGPGAVANVYFAHRGRIYRSTDGGSSFNALALIDSSASDAVFTGSEAGSPTLYVTLNIGGVWKLYRSDDAGVSASYVHQPTDFWGELCASTVDASTVMYGGVEVFRSTDGGANFAKINAWGAYYADPTHRLHADTKGIYAWPDTQSPNGESVFFCMDGGVWRSHASGANPLNLSLTGLGVSQYYSTLTSSSNTNVILAGAQDQGYQRGVLSAPGGTGPSTNFTQLISGDYGHLTSSDGTHALVYSNYPGFTLVQQGQGSPSLVGYIDFPATSSHLWLPPCVADPLDAASYFLCAERLYKFTRVGTSGTWNYAFHSTQDFAAGAANYLTALRFAPSDAQRAYACDDAGGLWYSTDHATSWSASVSNAPNQHYFYGNAFAVHPTDALEAVVGGAGYSTAGVLRTLDGGQTWNPLTGGLPATLVYGLAYSRDGLGDVYAACEAGAYRFERASGQWTNLMSNTAPLTLYWSVEAVGSDLIRFGTYGRGIWDYAIPQPVVATVYCTAKWNSAPCLPAISFTGAPSTSSATPFVVSASLVIDNKRGVLFYGFLPAAKNFQGGTLCVNAPLKRSAPLDSGGLQSCSGVFNYDMNARIQSGADPALVSGAAVYCQFWYRDPADPWTTGLSDALEFQIP